jgi:multidrug transporter EmrE-like cation transporter
VVYDSIVHISILPKTSLGRWSVGLVIASALFFVLAEVLTGFELFGSGFNPVLAVVLTIILAGILGAASATGLISIIKNKERSVLTFVSTAIALWGLIGAVGSLVMGLVQI